MRRATVEVTAEQKERFEREGFVVIERLTSVEEARMMARAIARVAEREGRTGAPLVQVNMPALEAGELVDTQARANAGAVARGLLGEGARFTGEQAMIKPAGHAVETPWHQDEAYWPTGVAYRAVTVWIALVDVTAANGCMRYVAGSHRGALQAHRAVRFAGAGVAEMEAVEVEMGAVVLAPLRAGDAVVHTCRTVHGAGPNVSEVDRVAMAMGFCV